MGEAPDSQYSGPLALGLGCRVLSFFGLGMGFIGYCTHSVTVDSIDILGPE